MARYTQSELRDIIGTPVGDVKIRANRGDDHHGCRTSTVTMIITVPDVVDSRGRRHAPKGGADYILADGTTKRYRGGAFVPKGAVRVENAPKGKRGRPAKSSCNNAPYGAFNRGHERSNASEVLSARLAQEKPDVADFLTAWDSAAAIVTPDDDREREAREAFDVLPRVDRRWEKAFGAWAC